MVMVIAFMMGRCCGNSDVSDCTNDGTYDEDYGQDVDGDGDNGGDEDSGDDGDNGGDDNHVDDDNCGYDDNSYEGDNSGDNNDSDDDNDGDDNGGDDNQHAKFEAKQTRHIENHGERGLPFQTFSSPLNLICLTKRLGRLRVNRNVNIEVNLVQISSWFLMFVHIADKHYWTNGFLMADTDKLKCVPMFLGELANDIFICGKSINLLRLCCPEVISLMFQNWCNVYNVKDNCIK